MSIKNNMKLFNNENLDSYNLLCPLCSSKLIFKYVNLNNKMLFCSNKNCIFPMNNIEMDKFIFNIKKNDLNDFFNDVKKMIYDQSLSNETHYEDKSKKTNKNEYQNLEYSDILSINDKNNLFDSFSENEDLKL